MTSCSGATSRSSSRAQRSVTRRPTSSSAVSCRPAASSRRVPTRPAAWPASSCMKRWRWMSRPAIQAATLNVARTFKKDKDYGSVEPGKVADLAIIEGDPLKDIWATQNVKLVVMDGKLVDVAFSGYKNPIPSFYAYQTLPMALDISPSSVIEGAGPITLRVRGEGMWPFHRVMLKREFGRIFNFNATELPTRYLSKNELEATIAPELLTPAGTYTVTVKGEGELLPESHRAHLIVGFRD